MGVPMQASIILSLRNIGGNCCGWLEPYVPAAEVAVDSVDNWPGQRELSGKKTLMEKFAVGSWAGQPKGRVTGEEAGKSAEEIEEYDDGKDWSGDFGIVEGCYSTKFADYIRTEMAAVNHMMTLDSCFLAAGRRGQWYD